MESIIGAGESEAGTPGPIESSPAGLRTRQAAMLYFFGARFGGTESDAAIVAFGFSFPVVLILGRCLIGVFYPKEFAAARSGTEPT